MRGLLPFLATRLLRAAIALWLVSTVVFLVMRLSGDPVPLLLPPDAPRSEIFRVRAELGLDRPLPIQYAAFLASLARGDFGRSIKFRVPAAEVVLERLPATLELGLTAFVLALAVAVPIGLLSAVRRNSLVDHAAMAVALVGQSAPTFFIGILFILIFSVKAGWLPTSGRDTAANLVQHAVGRARGAASGLHPHGPGQGLAGDSRHPQAHLQERSDPDPDHHRAPVRDPARRRRGDGDGVRLAGHRPPGHPVDLQPRLPGRAVRGVSVRCALHRRQLPRRSPLWRPRPSRSRRLSRPSRPRASGGAPAATWRAGWASSSFSPWSPSPLRGSRRRTRSGNPCAGDSAPPPSTAPTAGRISSAPTTS